MKRKINPKTFILIGLIGLLGAIAIVFFLNGKDDSIRYTYEEYMQLSSEKQLEYQESFDDIESFKKWLYNETNSEEDLPWQNGEKKPQDYTYEEYLALNEAQQLAFQESFNSFKDFDRWLRKATKAYL